MKKVIIMSGIPGCGKSTWANNYIANNPKEKVFIVASDEIRKELGGKVQYFEEEDKVWNIFLTRTNNYAKVYDDVTVIMDATNLTNHFRRYYFKNTPDFDKHILVNFNLPLEKIYKQNKSRSSDRIVNDEAMKRLINEYELIDEETKKMFDEYIEIN